MRPVASMSVAQEAVVVVGADDVAAVVDPERKGRGEGARRFERGVAPAFVAQVAADDEAVVADQPAAIVDVVDPGVTAGRARDADPGEAAAFRHEALEAAPGPALGTRELAVVVDAEQLGV